MESEYFFVEVHYSLSGFKKEFVIHHGEKLFMYFIYFHIFKFSYIRLI